MAKLKVFLHGNGIIDSAMIAIDDPDEKNRYPLKPDQGRDETKWFADDISYQPSETGTLSYALHVLAFTGTSFSCTITNKDNGGVIRFTDVTGRSIDHQAHSISVGKFAGSFKL